MDKRFNPMTPAEQAIARQALYDFLQTNAGLSVAETLRAIRQHLRITVADLAGLSGLSERYISQLEQGQGNPTLAAVTRLLKPFGLVLGVSLKS
ncbi:MAG: helix-turn-helix transcriptional regulator [Pseudomonadota bacterium]